MWQCETQEPLSLGTEKRLIKAQQAHVAALQKKPDYLFSNNYQDKTSWASLTIGLFELPVGSTELKVQLLKKMGSHGIELNSVILDRTE